MSIGVLMKLVQKEERETNVTKDTIYQESEENGSNKNIWQGRSLRHNCRVTNIGLGTKISRHILNYLVSASSSRQKVGKYKSQ